MTVVRPAARADAGAIAAIMNALMATTAIEWRTEPYALEEMETWLGAHDCVLVAEEDGEVVGLAAYGPFRDRAKWPGYRFTVENTVHVREDHWRTGIGHTLMHELIERACVAGMHTMVAAVDAANASSVSFHVRLGFTEVARMAEVGAKFGHWQDLVLLQRHLDARSAPGED